MLQSNFDIQIMHVVRVLRTSKGIKQETMANLLKMDRTSYGRIENGTFGFTPSQLEIISDELQVSIVEILSFVKLHRHQATVKELNSEVILRHFTTDNSRNQKKYIRAKRST